MPSTLELGGAGAVQQAGRGCLTSHGLPGQLGPGGQAREPPSELPETCRSTALPGAGPANILTLFASYLGTTADAPSVKLCGPLNFWTCAL